MWGDSYIKRFQDFIFPSILSQGNLLYLNKKFNLKVSLCILEKDSENVKKFFLPLNIKLNLVYIDRLIKKYPSNKLLHYAYFKAIVQEKRDHTKINFIFLNVDDFFSKNFFKSLFEIIKKRKLKCVLENKILVDPQVFSKKITRYKKDNIISIDSKLLFKLGMQSLSNFSKFSFINIKRKFNYNAYCIFHKINQDNIFCSGFLLHPLLIKPNQRINKIMGFLDYFFVPYYVNKKNLEIIKNNSKLFRVGISNFENYKFIHKFNLKKFTSSLGGWVTDEHVYYSKFVSHFFYKKASDKIIKKEKKKFLNLLNKILENQSHKKKSFTRHPYWVSKKNFYAKGIKNIIRKIVNNLMKKKIYYVK